MMKRLLDLLKHMTWVELVHRFLELIFILVVLVLIYLVYTRW
jgi:heme A synthase